MDDLFKKAIAMAVKAHDGQLRKYTNEPYITHPFAVAGLVASVTDDTNMIFSAILHDSVEDSDGITIDEIRDVFGNEVATIVEDLTDISKPEDGNRETRRTIDREHTANACVKTKTIKLADIIDNCKTIAKLDPVFAKRYLAEKRLSLEVLKDGDSSLYAIADRIVNERGGND